MSGFFVFCLTTVLDVSSTTFSFFTGEEEFLLGGELGTASSAASLAAASAFSFAAFASISFLCSSSRALSAAFCCRSFSFFFIFFFLLLLLSVATIVAVLAFSSASSSSNNASSAARASASCFAIDFCPPLFFFFFLEPPAEEVKGATVFPASSCKARSPAPLSGSASLSPKSESSQYGPVPSRCICFNRKLINRRARWTFFLSREQRGILAP